MSAAGSSNRTLLDKMTGADGEYARRVRQGGIHSALTFAINNRSLSARAVFTRAASQGSLGLAEFDALLAVGDTAAEDLLSDLVATMDPKILLALAGLLANQRLRERDVRDAVLLYSLVLSVFGTKPFGRLDRMHYLELLAELDRAEEFEEVSGRLHLPQEDWRQAMLLLANIANPWRASSAQGSASAWTSYVSALFNDDGVEDLRIASPADSPFDSILCTSMSAVRGGPKITVLVPTHNPGPRLSTALASLSNQTWRNLEIVVLDDGSEKSHRRYMDAWVERDPRIRVVRLSANAGNYAARNIGLRETDGVFVTVHDDDDWSHPRKLELQARHLIESPDAMANMSQLVRATDSLTFTRINGNYNFIQANYSSLMFRREPVISAIGYWDEVNRAGDAEFRNRLTAWHGSPPAVVGGAPMSFLRVREGSLTAGEIHRGYFDPRRRWYEASGNQWHRSALANEGDLYLPAGASPRRFSAPVSMVGARRNASLTFDVVYATEFRFPGGNTTVSVNEIQTLLAEGYRVGLVQLDSPVLGATSVLTDRILEVSQHPNCAVVSLQDDVSTDLLIVRHPTVMQYAEPRPSRLSAANAVFIVNHAPSMLDGTGTHYDIATGAANFEAIFGRPPVIAPESGAIRESLRGLGVDHLLGPDDWNGMLESPPTQPRVADPRRAPVLGRHSRDNGEKWPLQIDDLMAVYPIDGSRDVRFLGGAQTALDRLAPREVTGWTVYPFGSASPSEFLREVDFWVYFHAEHLIESFGMATAEAMASGAVVLLPHYMEPTFGPGAVYCKPEEVQEIVDEFWNDPAKYARQSRLALEVASSRFTPASFLDRVRKHSQGSLG